MDEADYERQWAAARDYNQRLLEKADRYEMTEAERAESIRPPERKVVA